MNCDTIDAILDDRRTALLSPAERQAAATHLGGCTRCAESWAANEALLGEDMGEPPPELLAQVQRFTADAAGAPRARRSWAALAAAVVAVAAIGLVLTVRPWATTVPEPSAAVAPEAVSAPAARAFVAGRDYEVLARPVVAAAGDGVPVLEFFMYPCFHCYTFEADLEGWAARAQSFVALTRVPVVFNDQAELLARAFYAADAVGKRDAMHAAFYDEIHVRGNPLASRAALAELFARFDVDAATFAAAFDSPAVDAAMQRARSLAGQYNVQSVPSLVVAGKYSTSPSLAGAETLAVVDQLVAEARSATCAAASRSEQSDYCALRNSR